MSLSFEGFFPQGSWRYAYDIADIEIAFFDDVPILFSASRWDAGINSYVLGDDGNATRRSQQNHAPGNEAFYGGQLAVAQLSAKSFVFALAQGEAGLDRHEVTEVGAFPGASSVVTLNGMPGGEDLQRPHSIAAIGDYVYIGRQDGGFTAWSVSESGQLDWISETPVNGHQTSLCAVEKSGSSYLISSDAVLGQISVWRQNAAGGLNRVFNLPSENNPGIQSPGPTTTIRLGDKVFVVVGGTASSSLTLFELMSNGALRATDHVIDGLEQRFSRVTALSGACKDDRAFVVVGGADDGITLLEVLENGKFLVLASFADTQETALQDVSALSLWAGPDALHIYSGSEEEPGLGHFRYDLGHSTAPQYGETLVGSVENDVLVAQGGETTLTGRNGADRFVFSTDHADHHITDYQVGRDVIDLSLIPMLYSREQVKIVETSEGAVLFVRDIVITVTNAREGALSAEDLLFDFGLYHFETTQMPGPAGRLVLGSMARDHLEGSEFDDTIRGQGGNDIIFAGRGGDLIEGGEGRDSVSFEHVPGRVLIDLQTDVSSAGFARFFDYGHVQGDEYRGIEIFIGSDQADNLRGDASGNFLRGGGVSDRLYGRSGDDTLMGEAGADALYGNLGADLMTGGSDAGRRDRYIYFSTAESGVGQGNRDIITDFVSGEDRIEISRFDADLSTKINEAFRFIRENQFTGRAGQLRYEWDDQNQITLVQIDDDGDRSADFEIELSGLISLGVDDFLL